MGKAGTEPGFKITAEQGFHITFANGWTVSVQFGWGNYCANINHLIDGLKNHNYSNDVPKCPDAEIAAWDPQGKWYKFGDGDESDHEVKGYVSPEDVLLFMAEIATKGYEYVAMMWHDQIDLTGKRTDIHIGIFDTDDDPIDREPIEQITVKSSHSWITPLTRMKKKAAEMSAA